MKSMCFQVSKCINPLIPGAFCENGVSWTFWWFLDWISAKLVTIIKHIYTG